MLNAYIFICYLAAARLTLGHCRGISLTKPMLIDEFWFWFRRESQWEPHNEIRSLHPAEQQVGFPGPSDSIAIP